MSTSANRASSNAAGGTALHGQIDAIGIFDLLRIAIHQQSTGRLLLFNDEMEAELYYKQGSLVEARSGNERGAGVLSAILTMERGEFAYVRGLVTEPSVAASALHEVLISAIKQHYRERVDSCRGSAAKGVQPYVSGVHPVASRVDVDAGWPDPERVSYAAVSTPSNSVLVSTPSNSVLVSAPSNSVASSPMVGAAPLAPGELGRAIADGTGRVYARQGQITSHETTCAALIAKLSYDLAAVIGAGNLQRFELHRSGKALLCRVVKDGIHVARVDSAPDLGAVWQGLEP